MNENAAESTEKQAEDTLDTTIKAEKKKIRALTGKILAGLFILIAAGAAAIGISYLNRSENIVSGQMYGPGISSVSGGRIYPSGLSVVFDAPAAKLDLVNQEIKAGAKIFPAVSGKWAWQGENRLVFSPETDWAPGTTYTVTLSPDIFEKTHTVRPLEYKVTTPPFSGRFTRTEFYEDPVVPSIKRVTASLAFTHPADTEDLKSALKASLTNGESYDFTITPAESGRLFYIVSAPVKIKPEEDFLTFSLKNVKNLYNGSALETPVSATVKIPSSATFFKVDRVYSDIVLNQEQDNTAEQVLFVDFSSAVTPESLAPYFSLYRYDGGCGTFERNYKALDEKDFSLDSLAGGKTLNAKPVPPVFKNLKPLSFTAVPPENEAAKTHMFKYSVQNPKNVCIIAQIKRGLSSLDDFILGETQVYTTQASRFPTDLKIAFDGSLLSFTGDKTLPLMTRGIAKIDAEIARIPAKSINHLISQAYGSFKRPSFNGYFSADNIAENFKETLALNTALPEKPNYASLNLNPYFENKKGIFIAKVKGYRTGDSYSSVSDERLILVTDIGIMVKNDRSGKTHTVFVSDFAEQKPLKGARVDLLGRNGIPVLTAKTDSDGKVVFPDYSGFTREKEPVAYVASKGNDVSYMPVDRSDRRLNYARFDVEGVYSSYDDAALKAYVFSSRGVYRPGETAEFGIIVKDAALQTPFKNKLKIEIRDSYGDNVFEKYMSVPESGLADTAFTINPLARTGNYRITVSTQKNNRYYQAIGDASFKVEEFTPETMRIKAQIGGKSSLSGWLTAEKPEAAVTLENLYGNPAPDRKVNAEIELVPTHFSFNKFKGYVFQDPLRSSEQKPISVTEKMGSVTTAQDGTAKFIIDLSRYAKGTYRLFFRAEGLEAAGGRSVAAQASVLVSPQSRLVGFKKDGSFRYIKKNDKRSVTFIAVDNTLESVEMPDVNVEVWQKKYVSALVKQPNGLYKYQSVEKTEQLGAEKITLSAQGTDYAVNTSEPGEYFLRVTDEKGIVLARVDYTVAGEQNTTYSLEKNAELTVKLSKNEYDNGETVQMQITAPYEGYGLITIEKDKVYAYKWFKTGTAVSTQEITVPDTVEGNAYINVAFIRNMESKEIFMSPLSYAVVPFAVNKAKRTIAIDLETPALVKPGEELAVTYKTPVPSGIIIYGANEGILSYAKYKLPDPLAAFMPKKALEVTTYQILDLILPDAGILKNLHSTGGDAPAEGLIARNLNPFARKTDKPVAFWSGVIKSGPTPQTYTYKVPDNFNGQIRIMAVAVNDTAFGAAQKSVTVRGDFAMTPSAPMNVIPGDVFETGTSIANMVENSQNLNVTLTLKASGGMEIIDGDTKTFSLDEGAEKSVKFKVRAKEKLGAETLTFDAVSGPHRTRMTIPVGIRPGMPYITDLKSGSAGGKVELEKFRQDLYAEYAVEEIQASTSPLVLARGLIRYLDKYPYGCTEQTVSRAFPMIAMLFKNPDLVKDVNVYDLFDTALASLKLRQTNNGGFSAWTAAGSRPDDFASVYAYHFLTYARMRDFDVPQAMMRKAASYIKETAAHTSDSDRQNELAAYAAYVLTLNGEITTNYLVNLETHLAKQDKNWKDSLAAAYVAAGYKLLKNDAKADEIIGRYKLGKDEIKDSRYLFLTAEHFPGEFTKIKDRGIDILLDPLKKGRFNSISSAYAVLALNAYPSSKQADTQIRFSAGTPSYGEFAALDFSQTAPEKTLTIESPRPFYYTITQQGFPRRMPDTALAQGIELTKEILNANGEKITSAELGEEVTVFLRVRTKGKDYVNDVAVVDLIPGCMEIVSSSVSGAALDSSELREDRAVFYLTAGKNMKEISYKAKVIAKGDFIVPPAAASALYDTEIKAHTTAGMISVNE